MNPQRPRDWSTARQKSWPPGGAEEFSTYAVRRYALHVEIGSGSVATVHLGRLLGPDGFARTVAVKRLRPQYARDTELVSMLLDGARLAARVRHPNVVPTLDIVTGDDVLVVTEYVHGESLATLLRTLRGRDAPAPLPVVAGIFAGILRGLHAVQEARGERVDRRSGLRHELSSQDVLVGADGVARLIDLGVGSADAAALGSTGVNALHSAESADAGGDAGRETRPDIFVASTILWEALAGRQLLPRILPEGFEPPSRYRAEITPAIDEVVARGLARAPAERFATMAEMALALEVASPPATPAQIGTWVESLARQALDERARLLARVDGPKLIDVSAPPRETVRDKASDTARELAPSGLADTQAVRVPVSDFVTRRERLSAPEFTTRRGLGPTGEAAERRLSLPAIVFHRKPRLVFLAGFATAALVALVFARYVGHASQAPAPVDPVETVETRVTQAPPPVFPPPAAETPVPRVEAAPPPVLAPPPVKVQTPPPATKTVKPRRGGAPARNDVL